jgi:hypothetical protein
MVCIKERTTMKRTKHNNKHQILLQDYRVMRRKRGSDDAAVRSSGPCTVSLRETHGQAA